MKIGYDTCYGRVIATRGGKHIWKLRVNHNEFRFIHIGVSCDNDPQTKVVNYRFTNHQNGYGYSLYNGKKVTNDKAESYRSNHISHVSGDVMHVI